LLPCVEARELFFGRRMAEQLTLELEDAPSPPSEESIVLRFDDGTLLAENLPRGAAGAGRFTFDDRVETYRAPAISYRLVLADLLREGWTVVDEVREYREIAFDLDERHDPYDHQREALAAWSDAGERGTVVLPTGSGKTYVAQLAMQEVERSTLVVVPTIDLMNQWSGVLEEGFDCTVGLLGGGYHETEDVTVATYDSAAMHMERIGGEFGFIVFDEVHHLPSNFYRRGRPDPLRGRPSARA